MVCTRTWYIWSTQSSVRPNHVTCRAIISHFMFLYNSTALWLPMNPIVLSETIYTVSCDIFSTLWYISMFQVHLIFRSRDRCRLSQSAKNPHNIGVHELQCRESIAGRKYKWTVLRQSEWHEHSGYACWRLIDWTAHCSIFSFYDNLWFKSSQANAQAVSTKTHDAKNQTFPVHRRAYVSSFHVQGTIQIASNDLNTKL